MLVTLMQSAYGYGNISNLNVLRVARQFLSQMRACHCEHSGIVLEQK